MLPTFLAHCLVEARQDNRAIRESGNRLQEFGSRRDGTGRSRGDDRHAWRCFGEATGFEPEQAAPPFHRPEKTELEQLDRQFLANDGKKA